MPAEKTRADGLRDYLTGAASDGGAQTDPDASLGNYRSSTEAVSMDVTVTNAIANITIEFAGGGNAIGAGTLEAVDANTLKWKDLGGAYGPSVPILNGETKILEAEDDTTAFIRITRTSAVDITGTATLTMAVSRNNVFGLDDASSAESVAGDTEYRAIILVNDSISSVFNLYRYIGELATEAISDGSQLAASGAGTITTTDTLSDWPESGFCHIKNGTATREIVYYSERTNYALTVPLAGREMFETTAGAGAASDTIHCVPNIAIGIDPDGVTAGGAAIQTIADESTAPADTVTWVTGITAATGVDVGTMTTTQHAGFWIKREIPAGMSSTAKNYVLIRDSFDSV